jgi:LmbE family N-acetylglucosaminyl deacetylase
MSRPLRVVSTLVVLALAFTYVLLKVDVHETARIIRSADPLWAGATTCIDVNSYVDRKIAAVAAHRIQYPIAPDMLPLPMLQELMGREYFVRVLPRRDLDEKLI